MEIHGFLQSYLGIHPKEVFHRGECNDRVEEFGCDSFPRESQQQVEQYRQFSPDPLHEVIP